MVPTVIALTGIPGDRKAHDMTKGERRRLLEVLKGLVIHIRGPRPIAEAIITSGGVKVGGRSTPRPWGRKKVPGLFFAGELIGRGCLYRGASTSRSPGPPVGRQGKAPPGSAWGRT